MSNISPGRVAGIIASLLLIVLIAAGGFGALSSTDASWSDQTTVNGTYHAAQLDEPTEPVEEPTEPTDPVEDATEPEETPTEPVDEPSDPVETPTEPEQDPTPPEDDPSDQVEEPIDQLEGHMTNLTCRSGKNDGNEKPVILTWDIPAAWQGQDIVYEVSWQDNVLTSYAGHDTVHEPTFGPFFPTEFPGKGQDQHADLTFAIHAKLADGEWRSEPMTIDAHGPTQGGVLHCGTSNRR